MGRRRASPRAAWCAAAAALVALGVAWGAAPADAEGPPPRPAGGRALCLRCHAATAATLEGRVKHAPVDADACTACHNPHAARHAALLRDRTEGLCLECHEDVGAEMKAAAPHGALADERSCLACHVPHAASESHLLRGPAATLCASCHEGIRDKLKLEHVHPAATGEGCLACHLPHAGEAALLRSPKPALCGRCHALGAELDRAHGGFDVGGADCTGCHEPHGSSAARLLRTRVHVPFADGACDACHVSPGNPSERTEAEPALCLTCHEEAYAAGPGAAGGHPAGAVGSDDLAGTGRRDHPAGADLACTRCHSPHAGESPGMIRGPERQVCLGCHAGLRAALARAASVHPVEAAGGRCTACHEAHGAPAAPLLARAPDALCGGCHGDHARFAHPMGPNVPDPRRPGTSVGCLSCHVPHASDQKMLLAAAPDRDLCVQCHARLE